MKDKYLISIIQADKLTSKTNEDIIEFCRSYWKDRVMDMHVRGIQVNLDIIFSIGSICFGMKLR